MQRQSLKDMFEYYCKHWNVLSCIGDHPKIVKMREERGKKLQRVKRIIDLTDDYENPKDFLDDIAFSKEIIEKAMSEEKFS